MIQDVDAQCIALRRRYPRHGIQRVLILGKDVPVTDKVRQAFDEVLLATDVLFDSPRSNSPPV